MSIEQQYYENDAFWSDAVFGAQDERFATVARHIPVDVRSLLDVGCDNGSFVNMLSRVSTQFETIHAVDRSPTALKHVQTSKTEASIDHLPFPDQSFDIVTALEVVEHLQQATFDLGLSSLCRVARKYVLISVPNEEDLEKSFVTCPSCRSRFNPDYHMRRFDSAIMQTLLSGHGFRPRETFFMGPKKRYFMVTKMIEKKLPFPLAVPCPVCGVIVPPVPASILPSTSSNPDARPSGIGAKSGRLKSLVKGLLHSGTNFGTVATVYERE